MAGGSRDGIHGGGDGAGRPVEGRGRASGGGVCLSVRRRREAEAGLGDGCGRASGGGVCRASGGGARPRAGLGAAAGRISWPA
jgi:hypothetical protein